MGIETAVIMVGGEGLRMYPVSKYLPKCYLPIYDEPLLVKQINWLISAGVNKVIIAADKRFGELISELLSYTELNYDINIEIIIEEEVRGIGYSLLKLKALFGKQPFIFLLGDEYFEQPEFFKQVGIMDKSGIIMGAIEYLDKDIITQGCNFLLDENTNCICKLIEKPKLNEIVSNWCWSGAAVLNESIFLALEECNKNSKEVSNKVLITAINNIIGSRKKVQYLIESSKNINLTSLKDYYRAFEIEFRKKNGVS